MVLAKVGAKDPQARRDPERQVTMKTDKIIKGCPVRVALSVGQIAFCPHKAKRRTVRVLQTTVSASLEHLPNEPCGRVETRLRLRSCRSPTLQLQDISSLSERTIYVLGKSPGTRTLTIADASGQLITNIDVRVPPISASSRNGLGKILPGKKSRSRNCE